MKSYEFDECNVKIAEHQEEYQTLPAFVQPSGLLTFCMEIDETELKKINNDGYIMLEFLNFNLPAQNVVISVHKPKFPIPHTVTPKLPNRYGKGTVTFMYKLRKTGSCLETLKKNMHVWVTLITHNQPMQPLSMDLG